MSAPPSRRTAPHASPLHRILPSIVLAVAMAAMPVRADDRPAPRETTPIWTTTPTRIDRSQETRQRLDPAVPEKPAPSLIIAGDGRVLDGGVVAVGERRYRLHGIAPIDRRRICVADDGRRWICGHLGFVAFFNLVNRHRLACRFVGPEDVERPVIDCLWRERSLSQTLVGAGWADLDEAGKADPALAAAAEQARQRGLGAWSHVVPE